MTDNVKGRFHFNVDEGLQRRINRIPWGFRSHVMRRMAEIMCDIYEKQGEVGLAAITSGAVTLISTVEVNVPNVDIQTRKEN